MDIEARIVVTSYSSLPASFTLGTIVCTSELCFELPTGEAVALVRCQLPYDDLERGIIEGWDLADELADRIALLTSAAVKSLLLSVTPRRTIIGQEFQFALPIVGMYRSRIDVDSSAIEGAVAKSTDAATAMRAFRIGCSDSSPFNRFVGLWTAMERMAAVRAVRAGQFITRVCASCQAVATTNDPATQQQIRELYKTSKAHSGDSKKMADNARVLRGKIAHGSKLQDEQLLEEVRLATPALHTTSSFALHSETGIRSQAQATAHTGSPLLVLKARFSGPTQYELRLHSCRVRFCKTPLEPSIAGSQDFEYRAGYWPSQLKLPSFTLPAPS